MICDVYDNVFDARYLHEFFDEVLSPMGYNITNIANRKTQPYGNTGSHRLLGKLIFNRGNVNDIQDIDLMTFHDCMRMYEMIENVLDEKLYLQNISVNIQPYGIDGTCHCDSSHDDEFTILVMTNPEWKKEWGPASFQLLERYDNNARVIEEHEYVPGRVLVIPSVHPHRGIAPTHPYVYRSSIVFRVTPNFDRYLP